MIAALVCLIATAPPIDAKRAAAQLIDEGNELLLRRQYQAALARYQAAHALYPTPKIFFNMAEAHRELKNFVEAIEHYERFIAESGVPEGSPLMRQAARAIADLQQRVGHLSVQGGPLGAEVFIDGKPAGRVPLRAVRLLPGFHQVVVQHDGAISKQMEIEVKRGEEVHADASPEVPVAALVSRPPPPVLAEPPITATMPIEEEEGSIASKWWFWTIIGGAVAIGVGAAILATTLGKDDFMLDEGDLGVTSTRDWRPL